MLPASPQHHSSNTSFDHDLSMDVDLNSSSTSLSEPSASSVLDPSSSLPPNNVAEDEDASPTHANNHHPHTAPVPIHPALVKQAEIQRRMSQERAAAELHAKHHQQHTLSSSPAALLGSSASSTPSPVTKRDSFRHSFVEIDHPLAHRSRPNGPSNPIDEDGEEIENEAAQTQQAQQQQQSLTHIIKKALMNASDADKIKEKRAAEAAKAAYSKAIAESEASIASADQYPNPTPQNTSPPAPIVAPAPLVPTTSISMSRCIKLLNWFVFYYSKNPSTYRSSAKSLVIQQRVTALAKLDYHVSVISNDSKGGAAANLAAAASVNPSLASHSTPAAADSGYEYCNTYPLELIIFENEKHGPYGVGEGDESSGSGHTLQSRVNDSAVLKPLFRLSRFSRVHGRFVIPVILVRNKNICRSSTLAIQAEAILNNVHAATKQIFGSFWDTLSGGFGRSSSNSVGASPSQGVQVGLEAQRGHDLQLLLHTATTYVEDLMVEHRKTKMGVPLTSSEKNEVWRYSNMKLNALPYPGCEFFTLYKMNQHSGLGLFFDWSQGFISSDLLLSNPCPMIPDEMLSCNGNLPPKSATTNNDADGKPVAPTLSEENLYQWFEFQHDLHDHQREHEEKAKKEALEREQFLKNEAMKAPVSPTVGGGPSSSPPVLSSAADELLDQLLGHSASSLDSDLATSTLPNGQSVSADVVSSSHSQSKSALSETTSNGSTSATTNGTESSINPDADSVAVADSTTNVSSSPSSISSATSGVSSSPLSSTSPTIPKPTHITSFSLYKSWDIVTLTKNYLLVLLAHVADESPNSGVLVHCISGWDRTPLFVSLLRLTLWADGEVHRSLSPLQILYFTIAYDWCGFGHQVHNRLEKGEDIFYFCFDFLQYITNHKFSLQTASEMRSKKRSVEAELHLERSATPAPASASISSSTSPVAVTVATSTTTTTAASSTSPHLEPVSEKPAAPKSALTSALKAAQANGLKPPPMRKSSSDGTGTLDPRDDDEPSLIVESSSYSPVNVHSLPPASSSYTAVKPIPSLSSFIIESHEATASAANSSNNEANSSAVSNGVDGTAPSNSIPIASSNAKDKDAESSSRDSTSTTPIGESLPKDGALLDAAAMQAAASSQAASGQQISRVSSWTDLNHSTDSAANTARTRRASIEKNLPHATTANDLPHFHAPPNASAQSLQRCERLLAVRSLFMTCFHHVLPSTPAPPFPSPHAPFTAHAVSMREAARARKENAHSNVKEAPVANEKAADGKSASVPSPSSNDSTSASSSSVAASTSTGATPVNRLPVAAPVAAPITKSGGWFSS